MDGQQRMDAHLDKTMKENNVTQQTTVNGMMKSQKIGCSYEDKTLTLAFPVLEWQANRAGMMHGGIICTAFDMTCAALARFFAGENYAPTISMDLKYVRPVQIGETMVVTAKATATGKRITQLTAEAYCKETGKLVATSASVFMNVDTSVVSG